MIRRLLRQFVNDDLSSKEHVTNWMGHIFLSAEIYETISTVPLSPDNILAWKNCKRRLRNGRRPTILQMSFFAYARRQNPTAKTVQQTETDRSFTTTQSESDDEYDLGETASNQFLFIHQRAAQKRILSKYDDIGLLDATYKTTKYSSPLLLLVVRTNVGYMTVVEFIYEVETGSAISEVMRIISEWNPDWIPPTGWWITARLNIKMASSTTSIRKPRSSSSTSIAMAPVT